MAVDTGHASPIPTAGDGETGHASPIPTAGYASEAGHASPAFYPGEGPELPVTIWRAFQSQQNYLTFGFDPAYSEDGGTLIEAHASWPSQGPYLVQLVSPAGDVYPGATTGCYSGISGQGDAIYVNRSGEIMRFACPRGVPRGTYTLRFTWSEGQIEAADAVRLVPRQVPLATREFLRAPVLGPWLER